MYTESYQKAKDFTQKSTLLCRSIAEDAFEMTGENLTRFSNQIKKLSEAKRPEEFFNIQRECIQENMEALSSNTEKFMHLYTERLEAWNQNFAACHKEAKEKVKETVDHTLHMLHPETKKTRKHAQKHAHKKSAKAK